MERTVDLMFSSSRLGMVAMKTSELVKVINDPRGPEEVISGLSSRQLDRLLDTLYRNLGTPFPEVGAEVW